MGLLRSQTDETEHRGAGCQACRAENHLGFSSRRGGAGFNAAYQTAPQTNFFARQTRCRPLVTARLVTSSAALRP
jgi:hypothetical protein